MNKNRLMRLPVPYNLLLAFLTGRITLADVDLPGDAEIVQVHHDYERQALCFFVHSALFEPVCDGCVVPALPPVRVRDA